jgi:hypothetical protein
MVLCEARLCAWLNYFSSIYRQVALNFRFPAGEHICFLAYFVVHIITNQGEMARQATIGMR